MQKFIVILILLFAAGYVLYQLWKRYKRLQKKDGTACDDTACSDCPLKNGCGKKELKR